MKRRSEQYQHLESDLGDDRRDHNKKRRYFLFSTVLVVIFIFASSTVISGQHSRVRTSVVQPKQKKNKINEQHRNSSLPHLILHVGPPKTATTSLQCEFGKNAALLDELTPYRYLGKWNVEGCRASTTYLNYSTENIFIESDDEEELLKGFMSHLEDSKIPIISNEGLSGDFFLASKSGGENKAVKTIQAVKKRGYETRFVVSYRRYFEWVPSYYQQRMLNLVKWGWGKSRQDFMEHSMCIASLQSYLDHIGECSVSLPIHRLEAHPVQMVERAVEDLFHEEINIFNSLDHTGNENDAENHMLGLFTNQTLEQSYDFQKELISGQATLVRPLHTSDTQRKKVEYIHLAAQIYERDLVPGHVTPSKLQKLLVSHHSIILKLFHQNEVKSKENPNEFPEKCLSESWQNQLLELSLKFEREIFPEWSRTQEDQHRQAFAEYSKKGKYCQWDGDQILENEQVLDYIRNIHQFLKPPSGQKENSATHASAESRGSLSNLKKAKLNG